MGDFFPVGGENWIKGSRLRQPTGGGLDQFEPVTEALWIPGSLPFDPQSLHEAQKVFAGKWHLLGRAGSDHGPARRGFIITNPRQHPGDTWARFKSIEHPRRRHADGVRPYRAPRPVKQDPALAGTRGHDKTARRHDPDPPVGRPAPSNAQSANPLRSQGYPIRRLQ